MTRYKAPDQTKNSTRPFILIPKELWERLCYRAAKLERKPRLVLVDILREWLDKANCE